MASDRVTEGVLAATGEFTAEARLFCSKNAITPLTGQAFTAKFNDLPPSERHRILADVLDGDYRTPSCPQCEKKMVLAGERRILELRNLLKVQLAANPRAQDAKAANSRASRSPGFLKSNWTRSPSARGASCPGNT